MSESSNHKNKPICMDYVGRLDAEFFPPMDPNGKPLYSVFIDYLERFGFVYDPNNDEYFLINKETGIFEECTVKKLKSEIYYLWDYHFKGQKNLYISDISSILSYFESVKDLTLVGSKFGTFLDTDYGQKYYKLQDYHHLDLLKHYKLHDKLIAFKNGIFNTQLEKILPHCGCLFLPNPFSHSFDLIKKENLTDCIDPDSKENILDAYLSLIPNRDTLYYYIYWVGQLLFSDRPSKTILHLTGVSDSGKTLLSEVLCDIIGKKESQSVMIKTLLDKHGTSIIDGKRLIVSNETSSSTKTSSDLIKELIGQKTFTINRKYKDPVSIPLTMRWIVCGNSYIDVDLRDDGINSRVKIIRLRKKIPRSRGKELYDIFHSKTGKDWLISASYYVWKKHWYDDEEMENNIESLEMKEEHDRMFSYDSINGWILSECGSYDLETVGQHFHKQDYRSAYNRYVDYCYDMDDKPVPIKELGKILSMNYNIEHKKGSGSIYLVNRNVQQN